MQLPHPHPVRVHGRVLFVVALLTMLVPPTWPAGARGAPVAPVPVGAWPLQPHPTVVRAFDPPDLPFGSGHRGVDLLGSPGQQVHSALPGRVTYAGWLAGRGVVVVDHGATRTTYEPVSALVQVGDLVARGQGLGTLELFGSHCFPRACLHWGWIRGEAYLDPCSWSATARSGCCRSGRLAPRWRRCCPGGHPSSRTPGWSTAGPSLAGGPGPPCRDRAPGLCRGRRSCPGCGRDLRSCDPPVQARGCAWR